MYYRLNDGYCLRGWQKLNAVLIKRPNNLRKELKPEEFNLLLLCDGETDFTDIPLSAEQNEKLKYYIEKKVVAEAEAPSPLSDDQQYKYYPNRFVNSVFWSVTGRCNYKCRHCFMDAPEGQLGELSHEEAMQLIDEMADCGVLKADLTGGETLIRKDLWEIIDAMLERQITVGSIYTNGWLLNDSVLDKLEERGLKPEISISFDGLGWHDWMRGIKGAEEAAIRALKLCQKRGFPTDVEFCVHKGNLGTVRETVNALAKLGVHSAKISVVSDTPLWIANCEGNALTQGGFTDEMLKYIPQFFEDGMPMNLVLCNVATLLKGKAEYKVVAEKYAGDESCLNCHLCGAARYSCYITPEGRLLPCMPMTACEEQNQFARFQDIGLRSGLSDSYYMQFVDKRVNDLLKINEKCVSCKYKLKCGGGCRALALSLTGDLLGADLTQCFLWENGYIEKIHKAADDAIAKYCKKDGKENEN